MKTDVVDANRLELDTVARAFASPTATRALFRRPHRMGNAPEMHHLPFLFWLMETARPVNIVTLGIGDGLVYFALCQAAARLGHTAQCLGVASDLIEDGVPEPLARYNEDQYGELSHLLARSAAEAVRLCKTGSIDLLAVRAGSGVSREDLMEDWLPRLSDRGVVILTGTGTETDPEIRALGDLLEDRYRCILQDEAGGIQTALVGDDQPGHLAGIADLTPATAGYCEVGNLFRRAGVLLMAEHQAGRLGKQTATLRTDFTQAEKDRKQLNKRLEELQEAYDARNQATARMQTELHDVRGDLQARDRAEEEARAELEALRREKDDLASHTAAEMDALRREKDDLSAHAEAAQAELEALRREKDDLASRTAAEMDALRREREALAARVRDSDAALETRFRELAALTREAEARQQQIETFQDRLEARDTRVAELEAERDSLHTQLVERDKWIAWLQSENAQIEGHRDALLDSTSWRVTAPVRSISRLVRR